jgi:hypothetical protein
MNPRLSLARPAAGALVWVVVVACLLPSPFATEWAVALLLLSPLVLVPLGLRLIDTTEQQEWPRLWPAAFHLQLPSALLLALAFALPAGWPAALLALPWLATTVLLAATGLVRLWRRGVLPWEECCVDAGLVFLVVGGGWAVLSRAGLRPLEFESIIVLLTAIHFHHAGFVLPLVTGLAGRVLRNRLARGAALGVMAGVPLVAAGITTTQLGGGPALECFAACVTALAGLVVAWLQLRLAVRPLFHPAVRVAWTVAALALAGSMVLAALYGCRFYLDLTWLDIPWMRALHGTANALGFGLVGLLAWSAAAAPQVRPSPPTHGSRTLITHQGIRPTS